MLGMNYICPKENDTLERIKDNCISLDKSCIPKQTINMTKYIDNMPGLGYTYLIITFSLVLISLKIRKTPPT